uniref:Uncharacterized protein n=1 Tax=Anguilla anguilla TaxID=7936 RepID=A0A0E9QJ50_ANGAN
MTNSQKNLTYSFQCTE